MMGRPVIITGANSSYFLMTCLLMESVRKYAGDLKFLVLDFGLAEAERRFFQSRNSLVEMPPGVPGISVDAHPYHLKTAIVKYLDEIERSSPIVWIDGDVVLGGDLVAPLNGVLSAMNESGSDVAACEECRIKDIFEFPGLNFDPFKTMLSASGISTEAAYYNGGLVIFRSREILEDWFKLASQTPFHALFDQNLLNYLVHTKYKITSLPQEEWNLHGPLLDEKSLRKILKNGKVLPRILHATSSQKNQVELVSCPLQRDFGKSYPVRFFRNSTLRQHQFALLTDFIGREFPHLNGTDVLWNLSQASPHAGNEPQPKIPPNSPCPCNSGKKFKHCHGGRR